VTTIKKYGCNARIRIKRTSEDEDNRFGLNLVKDISKDINGNNIPGILGFQMNIAEMIITSMKFN
jgi:hypothetical protein